MEDTELFIEHSGSNVGAEAKEIEIAMKEEPQFMPENSYISSGATEIASSDTGSYFETEERNETSVEVDENNSTAESTVDPIRAQIGDYPLPTQAVGAMNPPEPPATELSGDDLKENNAAENKESGLGEIEILAG